MAQVESTDRDEGVDELVTALLTASRVLVGVSAASLAEVEATLTLTQFRTLVVLSGSGGQRLATLADTLGVTPSTALRTVDRLLAAGLVTRAENPADRREVMLDLTADGAAIVADVTERRRRQLQHIVARMDARRRGALVAALTDFAHAAGERPAPETPAPLGW